MSTSRKLTADDLWTFKEMGNITLSPDGRRVAFVTLSLNKAKNERHSTIYLLQLDEQGHAVGEPRQLTSGVKNDTTATTATKTHEHHYSPIPLIAFSIASLNAPENCL